MPGVAEIAGWVGLGSLPAFIVWDLAMPSRRFETPRFWRLRAAVATVVTFYARSTSSPTTGTTALRGPSTRR